MLMHYEPNVRSTILFLNELKVKVNRSTVSETLQNHPDWPSLLCVSDSLHEWGIPNAAIKLNVNDLETLPVPFLANIENLKNPLAVITELTTESVKYYLESHTRVITESRPDFLKKWKGICLIAEPNIHSGQKDYKSVRRKIFLQSLLPISLVVVLVMSTVVLLQRNLLAASGFPYVSIVGIWLQCLILLSGTGVAILLLWYEIDRNNPLLHKVCSGIERGNCAAILTGKQAKIFNWLSWSEVGFFYFAGGLLTLIFAGDELLAGFFLVSWLSIFSLPYTIYSVHYQWRIAKHWCVLCLCVQALLLLGALNVFLNRLLGSFSYSEINRSVKYIMIYLLTPLTWFTIKPYLLSLQKVKQFKRQYQRIKFNTETFDILLKKQNKITDPGVGLGIEIGNSEASNIIIKVCNPYCGPCSKAHVKIETLLAHNQNLKVLILFMTPDYPGNAVHTTVSHLLAAAQIDPNSQATQHVLDDWYLSERKDYEAFAIKYPVNGKLITKAPAIEAMNKWCIDNKIKDTPTIFFNGYELPMDYDVEDLQYFLQE